MARELKKMTMDGNTAAAYSCQFVEFFCLQAELRVVLLDCCKRSFFDVHNPFVVE